MSKETKLLIGCALAGVIPFLVLLYFQKVWLGLFIAILCGAVLMGRLVSMSKNKFESQRSYLITYGLVLLIIAFQALSFAWDYSKRDFQKGILLEIRHTIEEGIAKSDVMAKMIHVLSVYHEENRESVINTFQELYPDRLNEEGMYITNSDIYELERLDEGEEFEGDHVSFFYDLNEEEDELTLIVVSEIALGDNPDYENYDGQTGRFEMMYVLNEQGVHYEVRN